jgi:hypothetical protein
MGSLTQLTKSNREAAAVTVQRVRWLQISRSLTLDQALVANSRALIAESRSLLATFDERSASPPHNDKAHHDTTAESSIVRIEPAIAVTRAEADRKPAMLSFRVIRNGSHFGWTIRNATNEVLGTGTAGTEFDARVEAFRAAINYIDQLKGRSAPKSITLH